MTTRKGRRNSNNPFKAKSHTTTGKSLSIESEKSYFATQNRIRTLGVAVTSEFKDKNPSTALSGLEGDFPHIELAFLSSSRDELTTEPGGLKVEVKKRAKRYEDSDAPLITWKSDYRELYLDAIVATEGRGRYHRDSCCGCGVGIPTYRCVDCFGLRMYCKACITYNHLELPLHKIEEWNSHSFFQTVALRDLGIQVQLGHRKGESCETPVAPNKAFWVLSWHGIHQVDVQFCGCPNAPARYFQLLEVGWFPTSYKEPQSAATFQLLRNFQITNEQGKLPATDFYHALEQIVDGTGLVNLPDRLSQFMLVYREWRHLRTGKQFGRAHDPTGLAGTQEGTAAVACRACPQSGKNLPNGWEEAPPHQAWLYNLLLSQDANFKQKARARPNDARDVVLSPGWAFVVNHGPYLEEVAKHVKDEDEISHCVGFAAIWAANSKRAKGLRATGIGSVSCSRHEHFRPIAIGDLQRGERYINMDYIFLSTLATSSARHIIITYDIACQWKINFFSRLQTMPFRLALASCKVQFKVPKFHLPMHKAECHARFALNFTEGTGKMDGEGIEREWSSNNESARSLSMMTAGARWEAQDAHCNHWNHRKMIDLENSLLKRLVSAISEAVLHHRSFGIFHEALQGDHSDLLKVWLSEVEAWERDSANPCPYDLPESTLRLAHVKKALAVEEFEQYKDGDGTVANRNGMVIEGLEIEEAQRSLTDSLKNNNRGIIQQTANQKRQTALLTRIRNFRKDQATVVPNLRSVLEATEETEASQPQNMPIYLPSSATLSSSMQITLRTPELIAVEIRLREAQATDSLVKLQSHLRARSLVSMYRDRQVKSQHMYTRHRALEDQLQVKLRTARDTYRAARDAMIRLRGTGDWMNIFQELKDEDIRAINERVMDEQEKQQYRDVCLRSGVPEDEINALNVGLDGLTVTTKPLVVRGESKRTAPSWIWYRFYSDGSQDGASASEIEASLRVEWCKARARARRSREELLLVDEEMRRTLAFCEWQSQRWLSQAPRRQDLPSWLSEGLNAYATEKAHMEQSRADSWRKKWDAIRIRARQVLATLKENGEEPNRGSMEELVVELQVDDIDERDIPEDIHMELDQRNI